MQISFYVLSENKAQDILGFICQLTQTALNKSSQSVLILSHDDHLVTKLDEALWTYDASGFIPHQRLPTRAKSDMASEQGSDMSGVSSAAIEDSAETATKLAPVLLSSYLPIDFKGIVLNTTAQPVNDFMAMATGAQPTRVLEIIRPDEKSMQEGRHKYKHYQQLGYQLTHFKV